MMKEPDAPPEPSEGPFQSTAEPLSKAGPTPDQAASENLQPKRPAAAPAPFTTSDPFPGPFAFLLALIGPWGIALAAAAAVLVACLFALNLAWEASPRAESPPANEIEQQPPGKGDIEQRPPSAS